MTTPTSDAIPSDSPLDLLFNAEKLDEAINTPALTYLDRFGVQRKTLAGAVATISAVTTRGAWATATLYAPRDAVSNSGTWYIALDSHTSGATFAGDLNAHWRVYQGVLAFDLADTANPANGPGMIGWLRAMTGAVATTLYKLLSWRSAASFEFFSAGQITSATAYNFATDVTAPTQAALDGAFAGGRNVELTAGGYSVATLSMPGSSTTRAKSFVVRGAGMGEVFATVQGSYGGTVLKSTTNAPVFKYTPDVANTGNGFADVSMMTFWGNSSTPVVDFDAFYGQSQFHKNAIIQSGVGDGLNIDLTNTSEVYSTYAINRDWNTSGLGAARVGVGFNLRVTLPNGAGGAYVRRTTSRGFKTGYKIGDGSTAAVYSPALVNFESSLNFNGVEITQNTVKAHVQDGYFEGGDGGTGVTDNGKGSTITGNIIFAGFSVAIDASNASTYGTYIQGNSLSAGSVAGTTLLKLLSSGAYGGNGKTASGNYLSFSGSGGSSFTASISGTTMTVTGTVTGTALAVNMGLGAAGVLLGTYITALGTGTGGAGTYTVSRSQVVASQTIFAGSIAGVTGIDISGIDPRLDWYGNAMDPRGPWLGSNTTAKIKNTSTSSDGTTGTGVYGMGVAQSRDGTSEAPHLGRGAVNLAVDSVPLAVGDLAAGILTLGEYSVFTLTFASAQSVTRFAAPNLPDKTFSLHITNGNTTLTQGTYIKLAGSVNYTPGANGAWLTFQIKPGGISWETSRTVY